MMSDHDTDTDTDSDNDRGIDPEKVLADDVEEPDTTSSAAGDDGRPDPSEVPSLTREESIYQRDEHGELIAEDAVIKIAGQWRAVKHKPATRGFLNRFEKKFGGGRDEVDWDEMDDLIADFYTEPEYDPDELEDIGTEYYVPLMSYIVEYVKGGIDDDVTQQLAEEVKQRQAAAGN